MPRLNRSPNATRVTLTSGDLVLLDPQDPDEDPVVPLVVVSGRPVDLPHGVIYVLRDDLPLVEELQPVFRAPGERLQRLVRARARSSTSRTGSSTARTTSSTSSIRLLTERGLWHRRAPRCLFLV